MRHLTATDRAQTEQTELGASSRISAIQVQGTQEWRATAETADNRETGAHEEVKLTTTDLVPVLGEVLHNVQVAALARHHQRSRAVRLRANKQKARHSQKQKPAAGERSLTVVTVVSTLHSSTRYRTDSTLPLCAAQCRATYPF